MAPCGPTPPLLEIGPMAFLYDARPNPALFQFVPHVAVNPKWVQSAQIAFLGNAHLTLS